MHLENIASQELTPLTAFDQKDTGFHIETKLYYVAIGASCVALWRRFWNWLAWNQIDRMCAKYQIPHYDQKALMDAYEGVDTRYGEPKGEKHENYQQAIEATNNEAK